MSRQVMLIDLQRCCGCHGCLVACKSENNLPDQVFWNKIMTGTPANPNFKAKMDVPTGKLTSKGGIINDTKNGIHNLDLSYYTKACQHCANPICVDVCPTGASFIHPNGVVDVNPQSASAATVVLKPVLMMSAITTLKMRYITQVRRQVGKGLCPIRQRLSTNATSVITVSYGERFRSALRTALLRRVLRGIWTTQRVRFPRFSNHGNISISCQKKAQNRPSTFSLDKTGPAANSGWSDYQKSQASIFL